MPRWARFLSCTFTGLLLSLLGFVMVAYWQEGGPQFWPELFDFFATPAFWSLAWLFGLLSALALVIGRVARNLYGLSGAAAGLLAGLMVALAYASFLVATHAVEWGGLAVSVIKVWPAVVLFSVPLGIAGALMSMLWERLG